MKYFGPNATMDDNEVHRELLEWLWKGSLVNGRVPYN